MQPAGPLTEVQAHGPPHDTTYFEVAVTAQEVFFSFVVVLTTVAKKCLFSCRSCLSSVSIYGKLTDQMNEL